MSEFQKDVRYVISESVLFNFHSSQGVMDGLYRLIKSARKFRTSAIPYISCQFYHSVVEFIAGNQGEKNVHSLI